MDAVADTVKMEPDSISRIREKLRITGSTLTFNCDTISDDLLVSVADYLPMAKGDYIIDIYNGFTKLFELRDAYSISSTNYFMLIKDKTLRYINEISSTNNKYFDSDGNVIHIMTQEFICDFDDNKLTKLKIIYDTYTITVFGEDDDGTVRMKTIVEKITDSFGLNKSLEYATHKYKEISAAGEKYFEYNFAYRNKLYGSYKRINVSGDYTNVNMLYASLAIDVSVLTTDNDSFKMVMCDDKKTNIIEYYHDIIVRMFTFCNVHRKIIDESVNRSTDENDNLYYIKTLGSNFVHINKDGITIKLIEYYNNKIKYLVKQHMYNIEYNNYNLLVRKENQEIEIDINDIKMVLDSKIPVKFKYV